MSDFKKYQHIERFGTEEVDGIEIGTCYIFPKIDGTNASIWLDEGDLAGGSRKRELSTESDNGGFYNEFVLKDERVKDFFNDYHNLRLYGEWLIPHSLKTYRTDAWKKFYVFDVCIREQNVEGGLRYLTYKEYEPILKKYNFDYVPYQTIIKNPSFEQLIKELNKNTFLIEDGKGCGEGIVIKNYDFVNKYGRQTWAKIVTTEFKEQHRKEMGGSILDGKKSVEEDICEKYCTNTLIDKTFAKIKTEKKGWSSKYIPILLSMVFKDIIEEEMWDILKKFKNPKIDFKRLNSLIIIKIKEYKKDIF